MDFNTFLADAIRNNDMNQLEKYADKAEPSYTINGLNWIKFAYKVGNRETYDYVEKFFYIKRNYYSSNNFLQKCFDNNDLESLQYAHKHFGSIGPTLHWCDEPRCTRPRCRRYDPNLVDDALLQNKHDIVKWLYDIGMRPKDPNSSLTYITHVIENVHNTGDVDFLKKCDIVLLLKEFKRMLEWP